MNRKKFLILTSLFTLLLFELQAQEINDKDDIYWASTKEIGLNFTPLISSLIPFNLSKNKNELVGFRFKKYFGKAAFKFNMGADISDANAVSFIHLGIGFERRHFISKKIYYTAGWMVIAEGGDNNDQFSTDGGFGVSNFYGFEYHFNHTFFISTEAQLMAIFGENFKLKFQPPISIFANIRL